MHEVERVQNGLLIGPGGVENPNAVIGGSKLQ